MVERFWYDIHILIFFTPFIVYVLIFSIINFFAWIFLVFFYLHSDIKEQVEPFWEKCPHLIIYEHYQKIYQPLEYAGKSTAIMCPNYNTSQINVVVVFEEICPLHRQVIFQNISFTSINFIVSEFVDLNISERLASWFNQRNHKYCHIDSQSLILYRFHV